MAFDTENRYFIDRPRKTHKNCTVHTPIVNTSVTSQLDHAVRACLCIVISRHNVIKLLAWDPVPRSNATLQTVNK